MFYCFDGTTYVQTDNGLFVPHRPDWKQPPLCRTALIEMPLFAVEKRVVLDKQVCRG